jgi:hypothetical protein
LGVSVSHGALDQLDRDQACFQDQVRPMKEIIR